MNKAILTGFTGRDPETLTFANGTILKVSLATNEYYKDAEGNKKTITMWHNLVLRGKLVEVAEKYIRKGNQITVIGKIRYREYDGENGKQKITEIHVEDLELLSNKENGQQTTSGNGVRNDQPSSGTMTPPDDDLPF